ncbi:MAG: flippase [Aggregatilineales bacterium]
MSETPAQLETPARSAGQIIARNTLWGIAAQFALKGANFVFSVLVVRTLGGEEFGQYWIVMAWAGLFSVIGDLGITQYLTREIARSPQRNDDLFWDTVFLRFVLAVLATVVTVGGALLLTNYSSDIILGILLFCGTYFFQVFLAPLTSVLVGRERIDISSALTVVTQVLWMVFAGLFLFLGFNFLWLFIAGILSMPVVTALAYWFVQRNNLGPPRLRVNPALWMSVIRAGLPFGFTQLALSFAFRVDTIVLSQFVSEFEVGLYNVAYNLVLTLLGLSASFGAAVMPTLAHEHARDPASILPWYYSSVRLLMFIGLPVAVGGMLTAPHIVDILYQSEIAPAAILLAILVWDLPFVMYHSFAGQIANSTVREGAAARIYVSLGFINLALNLIMVPRVGVVGAAFATVLTDATGAALFYFLYRREFGAGLGLKRLIRFAIAAGLMGFVVLVLGQLNFFVIVAVSTPVYLGLVWISGAFSQEEKTRLVGFVQQRLSARFKTA